MTIFGILKHHHRIRTINALTAQHLNVFLYTKEQLNK